MTLYRSGQFGSGSSAQFGSGASASHLGRRTVLAAGAGISAAAAAAFVGGAPALAAPSTPAVPSPPKRAINFLNFSLDAYLAKGPTRLPQSHADQLGLFSTSFVYDSALALLAYLYDKTSASTARAKVIGDALLFCQNNDPNFSDGRLRQGYNVGPYVFYDGNPQPDGLVRADGKANVNFQFGFLGTAVGDMAWVGIALANLANVTRDRRYLAGAVKIGEWIVANTTTNEPLGGYKFGVDGGNNKLPFTSTEHNIDVIGLFNELRTLTGDKKWTTLKQPALTFLQNMWEPTEKFFWTGTNDGVNINQNPIPEDPQSWSYLALESRTYERSIDYAIAKLSATDTPQSPNSFLTGTQKFTGITFSSASLTADPNVPIDPFNPKPDPNAVWFEGTAQIAAALNERRKGNDTTVAKKLLGQVELAQDQLGNGQTFGGATVPARSGVVAASSPLNTGFGFGYYQFKHVGATAWYLIAVTKNNPYTL